MDEHLTRAYDELTGSVHPPPDARGLVAARRSERGRRRMAGYATAGVAAACSVLVATLVTGGDTPVTTAEEPTPAASVPDEVTCPDGAEPRSVVYDHPGYATFTRMLRAQAEVGGAYTVDRSARTIYFLRPDGTAHSAVPWMGSASARWFPDGRASCADSRAWVDLDLAAAAISEQATLQVGHCWIERAQLFGQSWDVVAEDQFGWGGGHPKAFESSILGRDGTLAGTAWLTGDVVTYVDDAGGRLTLVPEGDPWTLSRQGCA